MSRLAGVHLPELRFEKSVHLKHGSQRYLRFSVTTLKTLEMWLYGERIISRFPWNSDP